MSLENDITEDNLRPVTEDKTNKVKSNYEKYIIVDARGVEIKVLYEYAIKIPLFKAKIDNWLQNDSELLGKFYVNFSSDEVHKTLDKLNNGATFENYVLLKEYQDVPQLTFDELFYKKIVKEKEVMKLNRAYYKTILNSIKYYPKDLADFSASHSVDTIVFISLNNITYKFLIIPWVSCNSGTYTNYVNLHIKCGSFDVNYYSDKSCYSLDLVLPTLVDNMNFLLLFYKDKEIPFKLDK